MALSDRPAERHRQVAGLFTERACGTRSWDAPSPVPEWTARDVVRHLTEWFPAFLASGAGLSVTDSRKSRASSDARSKSASATRITRSLKEKILSPGYNPPKCSFWTWNAMPSTRCKHPSISPIRKQFHRLLR